MSSLDVTERPVANGEVCGATLSVCRCTQAPHPAGTPHVCGEVTYWGTFQCGGSWIETDDPDNPEIVAYPILDAP